MNIATLQNEIYEEIAKKIQIFPTWSGRDADEKDRPEEYDIHRAGGYTFPFNQVLDSLRNGANYEMEPGSLIQEALRKATEVEAILKNEAKVAAVSAANQRITSAKKISGNAFNRLVENIVKKHKTKLVIVVPDLWMPES